MVITTDGSVRFSTDERSVLIAAATDWQATGLQPGGYLGILVKLGRILAYDLEVGDVLEVEYGEDTAQGEETCEREELEALARFAGEGGRLD